MLRQLAGYTRGEITCNNELPVHVFNNTDWSKQLLSILEFLLGLSEPLRPGTGLPVAASGARLPVAASGTRRLEPTSCTRLPVPTCVSGISHLYGP